MTKFRGKQACFQSNLVLTTGKVGIPSGNLPANTGATVVPTWQNAGTYRYN